MKGLRDESECEKYSVTKLKPVLGIQSILPYSLPVQRYEWERLDQKGAARVVFGEHSEEGGFTIFTKIIGVQTPDDPRPQPSLLPLFTLSMPIPQSSIPLAARITYRRHSESKSLDAGFYLAYASPSSRSSALNYLLEPAAPFFSGGRTISQHPSWHTYANFSHA